MFRTRNIDEGSEGEEKRSFDKKKKKFAEVNVIILFVAWLGVTWCK